MSKSMKEEVYRFIKEWKEVSVENGDVDIPKEVLTDVREAAVVLAVCFMTRRRDMLQMAVKQGRFDILPAILRIYDNCHDEESGMTAAQAAALTSHVASICVLAKHDITTLYEQSTNRISAYDVLYSVLCNQLVVENPDDLTPACIYTYGENAACSLGHASRASFAWPTLLDLDVNIVKNCTISLGRYHTLFLIDGVVYSCGLGRDGRLGQGHESDLLVPQKVFLEGRHVVAISAGPNHSVVCTKKEIIVFGRNENGQLGISAAKTLIPTIAYALKKRNAEIKECFAGATFSAVVTSLGKCIASGSLPWDNSRQREFTVSLNPIFEHRTVRFFDKCVVGLQKFYAQTKVDVVSLRGGFSTRLPERYECEGAIETYPVIVLLKAQRKGWQVPIFTVLCQHPHTHSITCVEVNFVVSDPHTSIHLQHLQLSSHGEFIAVSPNFIAYQGYISEEAVLAAALNEPTSSYGRNKAILTYTIPADKLVSLREPTPRTEAKEVAAKRVEVVCVNDEGKEVEVFKARRNLLVEESDYCRTFFFRWCGAEDEIERITFFDGSSLVCTFLRYCERSLQLSELPRAKLYELLHFADKYACSGLFIHVLNTILRMPFTLSTLRDLYEVSRTVTNDELNRCVDTLGAYLMPLMLSRGLAQQLTPDELHRIERQYSSIVKCESSQEVDDRQVCGLAVELFENLAKLFSQSSDEFDFEEMLNAYLLEEKSRPLKTTRHGPKSPDQKALTPPNAFSKKGKLCSGSNKEKKMESVVHDEGLFELELSLTTPLLEVAGAKVASGSVSPKSPVTDRDAISRPTTLKGSISEAVAIPKSEARTTPSSSWLSASSVSESWPSSPVGVIRNGVPASPSTTVMRGEQGQLPSTSRIVPSRAVRPRPWGGLLPSAPESLSEILADEAKHAASSENKRPIKDRQTPQKEIRGERKGWCKESIVVESNGQTCGLQEIMAEEVASQNEAKRLNDSRLTDIDIEEQAIAELLETYEAEATLNGNSVTVSAERYRASVSEPLWAARS